MVRWWFIVVVGLCVAAPPSSADNDFARQGPYLGIGASYAFENFSLTSDNLGLAGAFGSGVDPNYDDSTGVDVQIGYRIDSLFAVEFLYGFLEGFDSRAGFRATEIDLHLVTVNAKFFPPLSIWDGRLQLYALAGLGTQIVNSEVRDGSYQKPFSTDAGFVGRVGGGLSYHVTDSFSVELEAAYMLPAGGWTEYTEYSSLGFHFLRHF